MSETLIERLRKRAEIRRQISSRKSVQEGKPDRISDLLEEAASELRFLTERSERLDLIDKGCANCGGLPHTTTCNWRDPGKMEKRIQDLEEALGNHPALKCAPGAHHPDTATGPCEECEWQAHVRLLLSDPHLRKDGTPCPYMATTFCNKCGWLKDR